MKDDDLGYDLATIMLAVEVYKLRRDHPAEPADSIAEMLGRMLALAEFSQPADSQLRKFVDDVIAFDQTPLPRLPPRSGRMKRSG
jgi:hypothetical protein